MMKPFGGRCHFKPLNKRFIFPEELEDLAEMRVFYLLANFNERLKHFFNIFFRREEEIGDKDGFFSHSLNMGDIKLEMFLERPSFPLHMDEVVLLEGFNKSLHVCPNPALHFSCA